MENLEILAGVADAQRPSKPPDRVRLPGGGLPCISHRPRSVTDSHTTLRRSETRFDSWRRHASLNASAGHWRASPAVTRASPTVTVRLRPDALLYVNPSPGGGTGRRATSRGSCPQRAWEFDSPPGDSQVRPGCAGAPLSFIRTAPRLNSGTRDYFDPQTSRGPTARLPVHTRATVVRLHSGRFS